MTEKQLIMEEDQLIVLLESSAKNQNYGAVRYLLNKLFTAENNISSNLFQRVAPYLQMREDLLELAIKITSPFEYYNLQEVISFVPDNLDLIKLGLGKVASVPEWAVQELMEIENIDHQFVQEVLSKINSLEGYHNIQAILKIAPDNLDLIKLALSKINSIPGWAIQELLELKNIDKEFVQDILMEADSLEDYNFTTILDMEFADQEMLIYSIKKVSKFSSEKITMILPNNSIDEELFSLLLDKKLELYLHNILSFLDQGCQTIDTLIKITGILSDNQDLFSSLEGEKLVVMYLNHALDRALENTPIVNLDQGRALLASGFINDKEMVKKILLNIPVESQEQFKDIIGELLPKLWHENYIEFNHPTDLDKSDLPQEEMILGDEDSAQQSAS